MTSQPLAAKKDILGYTLQERIGSGGYGEVWSAVAPGGILKAIKVVYGFHDEKRAQTEIKALDRVKELRHPFLLSLERIEVFEGQLVVVTELADNSLADVFNEFAIKGEPGIPREQLIKYTRCAADALDYMSNEHNLQHLDIKPENFLMVGGHVKVADFGLIKDLENASQSLMSGMTPAYAAPELFDGRPGTKSDQYSLAIVFQEMLTGIRPFPGTTPAQLAAQHMHGKPNLRPLPKGDQIVIAKALSKDPNLRFNSCQEMVEELANKKRSVKKAIRRTQPPGQNAASAESKTIELGSATDARDVTALLSGSGLPFQAAELKSLAPPECDETIAKLRPTLIVTVGATANRVAQKIKKQINSLHGSMDNVPSTRILSIDSDRQNLDELRMQHGKSSLSGEEVIETLLRKPEVYRERSKSHLSWLSRRWIYNVPRTLQTEGLRPLGRLAFADHFETICDRIQTALKQITAPENLAKSADTLDMDPGELAPRVYIVTSISGGAGSGMALDLGYTLKLLMHENGMPAESVSAILLHSNYQRTRDPGLSAANAFAFFTEMRHFVENGYPGDESLGIPEFEEESPFDFTYFNNLGDNLLHSEFEGQLEKIAEYVYLASSSKCSKFFDQCQRLETNIEHFSLRTFGICSTGPSNPRMGDSAVNRIGRGLIRRWINGDTESTLGQDAKTSEIFAQLELNHNAVLKKVEEEGNSIFDGQFSDVIESAKNSTLNAPENQAQHLIAYLDGLLGRAPERCDASHVIPEFAVKLEEFCGNEANATGEELANLGIGLIGEKEPKLNEAKTAINSFSENVESLRKQLEEAITSSEIDIQSLVSKLSQVPSNKARMKPNDREALEQLASEYCEQRFQQFVKRAAKNYYRGICNLLDSARITISRYTNQIESMIEEFESDVEIDDTELVNTFNMDRLLSDSVDLEIQQHIQKTELQVYESMVKDRGGYLEMLSDPSDQKNQLSAQIRMSAQGVLADAYRKVSLDKVIKQNNVGPEQLAKWLNERVCEARPQVDSCGGGSRLMIGLPELSDDSILPDMLEQQLNLKSSTIKGTQGNFVICFEAEDVVLANVAFRLLEARPDAIELVKRIHTRNDIQWTTLDDLL